MKFKTVIAAFCIVAPSLNAQIGGNPVTPPPGPPTNTFRTLDQVEARTPIVEGAPGVTINTNGRVQIAESGSYFLTSNLVLDTSSVAISITGDNVTLDLNGFAVRCNANSDPNDLSFAIEIAFTSENVMIKNGSITSAITRDSNSGAITDAGFYYGIRNEGSNLIVQDLLIDGIKFIGINNATLVERCIVTNTAVGIQADQIKHSHVTNCSSVALEASKIVSHSVGESESSEGIISDIVISSTGSCESSKSGIRAKTVTNSIGVSNRGHGIEAEVVSSSTGSNTATSSLNTSSGILATQSVTNSKGIATGDSVSSAGIRCEEGTVINSYGSSQKGNGIVASIVSHSTGKTEATNPTTLYGINCDIASYSIGIRTIAGTALWARDTAVACSVSTGSTIVATEKHLGTP